MAIVTQQQKEEEKYCRNQLWQYLKDSRGITKAPFSCLNPSHPDVHPSMGVVEGENGPHCHCFSCNQNYDVFDIIGMDYNLDSFPAKFQKAKELFGLVAGTAALPAREGAAGPQKEEEKSEPPLLREVVETDALKQMIEAAHEELLKTPDALAYYTSRGISMEMIKKYKLGYVPAGTAEFEQDFPAEYQTKSRKAELYNYILPYPDEYGSYGFFAAEISDRSKVDNFNGKYQKIRHCTAEIFNERYLKKDVPPVIFICEGYYDALSVEQAGGKAIGLIGVGQKRFLSLCEEYKPDTMFVLALDNDGGGSGGIERIREGLDAAGYPYITKTAIMGKDFNEDLQEDEERFMNYIADVEAEAMLKKEEDYLKTSAYYKLKRFKNEVDANRQKPAISTGLESLDEILDGGLHAALYIVGAITSLGKTTFAMQIMDEAAAAGNDVLVLSLEMSENDLIAKSISRHTLLRGYAGAKTAAEIWNGKAEDDEWKDAGLDYAKYAKHIYFQEGIGDVGVAAIRERVEQHIKKTGNRPVVMIDYAQIMAPYNERFSDKQNTDANIRELKRISRDFSVPVLAISSFNRDNYYSPVNFSAFKESGSLEYSSDVVIALQYAGMDYQKGEAPADREKRIRELVDGQKELGKIRKAQKIQIKVLKQRNFYTGSASVLFYPAFNCFSEERFEPPIGIDSAGNPIYDEGADYPW